MNYIFDIFFCGLDESPSEVGAEPMVFSTVFIKNVLKSSTIFSSFSTKLPLSLTDIKPLEFVLLLEKRVFTAYSYQMLHF